HLGDEIRRGASGELGVQCDRAGLDRDREHLGRRRGGRRGGRLLAAGGQRQGGDDGQEGGAANGGARSGSLGVVGVHGNPVSVGCLEAEGRCVAAAVRRG